MTETTTKATSLTVDDLVSDTMAGRIRIPRFQRGLRWTATDVRRLFESIDAGYPIGSMLFWTHPAPKQTLVLGDREIDAPELSEANWVVDGQQRITSLVNALTEPFESGSMFALGYDVREGEFVQGVRSHAADDVVPLPTLFDLSQLLVWFNTYGHPSEYLEKASRVTKRLREYSVPVYQVRTDDERVLQDIFDRMNTYGRKLKRAEVFHALNISADSADNESSLSAIAEHLASDTTFGLIDESTILLSLLSRRGADPSREIRLEFGPERLAMSDINDDSPHAAYVATEQTLGLAIRFLQQTALIPHMSFIPQRFIIPVLTRFFAFFPQPHPRNLTLLRRWTWRALTNDLSIRGGSPAYVRTFNKAITVNDEDGSIQRLLALASAEPIKVPDTSRFSANSSDGRVLLCALWAIGPRDIDDRPFTLEDLSESIDIDSTASAALVSIGGPRDAGARLLYPVGDRREEDVDEILADYDDSRKHDVVVNDVCRSHLFLPGHPAWSWDDVISRRNHAITESAERFLTAMQEPDADDAPPLRLDEFEESL